MSGNQNRNTPHDPPPGRGDKTTVIVAGESYGVRVIETEESVIINYYAELEDALPDSAAVKQTLNQALRNTGRANTDKTLIYEAL